MDLFAELQNLMIKYHFRPEKKLSQFYCINEALLIYLTKVAQINDRDTVLEIGPGTGFLTRRLLEKARKVFVIEKDNSMVELLKQEFEDDVNSGRLRIIEDDASLVDYNNLDIDKIVCLPPYHISSTLVTKIAMSKIKQAVLVLDSGFIEKLTAFEGFKEYNALTALLSLNAKIEVTQAVDKDSFFPKPNCQSAVVNIEFTKIENSEKFFTFLKELFRHKNKDLSRAMKQAMPFLVEKLEWKSDSKKMEALKYSDKKVYAMNPQELLETYKFWKKP